MMELHALIEARSTLDRWIKKAANEGSEDEARLLAGIHSWVKEKADAALHHELRRA
jgi:hypothetical protein